MVECPVLFDAVLNPVRLNRVDSTGFVLKHHSDGVPLLSSDHGTWRHKRTETVAFKKKSCQEIKG